MSTASPVNDVTFTQNVVQRPGAVLVEFWKEGCGPCEAFKPQIDAFAKARPDITVATYEIVLNSPMHRRWKRFGIQSTPTVILFRDGEVVWKSAGVRTAAQLAAQVDAVLDAPPQRGVA